MQHGVGIGDRYGANVAPPRDQARPIGCVPCGVEEANASTPRPLQQAVTAPCPPSVIVTEHRDAGQRQRAAHGRHKAHVPRPQNGKSRRASGP